MRELMQFLDTGKGQKIYYTHFDDEIQTVTESAPIVYGSNSLKPYKERVKDYLKEHEDTLAVYKLRNNKQLTTNDLEMLEKILWEELGSKEDYTKDYGEKPVGMLVREIVGMEHSAVNEAFSEFISAGNLNSKQIDFVNMIITYIVKNGNIVDVKTTFSQQPFKGFGGGVSVLFKGKMPVVKNIMDRVAQIKKNAEEVSKAL